MAFPDRNYYSLTMAQSRWNVQLEDVHYVIENGLLRSCVHLPMRWMEYGHFEGEKFIVDTTKHCHGLVALRAVDTHDIFIKGHNTVTIFESLYENSYLLRLAREPYQKPLKFTIDEVLVLKSDCENFERDHQIEVCHNHGKVKLLRATNGSTNLTPSGWQVSNNYQNIIIEGADYQLGSIQAKVVEQLHSAMQSGKPWLYGKELLYAAGSTCPRMRDVFKSQPEWKQLIKSDGRGYYALNLVQEEIMSD